MQPTPRLLPTLALLIPFAACAGGAQSRPATAPPPREPVAAASVDAAASTDAGVAMDPSVAGLACCIDEGNDKIVLGWAVDGHAWSHRLIVPYGNYPAISFPAANDTDGLYDLSNVAQLATAYQHACALARDGTVMCWGTGPGAGTGTNSMTDRVDSPTAIHGVEHAVQISAGGMTSCALEADGAVVCWGDATCAAPYLPSVVGPARIEGLPPDVAEVSVGSGRCCVRTRGGNVSCWGSELSIVVRAEHGTDAQLAVPHAVTGLDDAVQISAGGLQGCALTRRGTISCWGQESMAATDVPGLAGVARVGVGNNQACAITPGGEMYCWGNNVHGQLGDGTLINRPAPVRANARDAAVLSVGFEATCAASRDGTVQCFGSNMVQGPDVVAYPTRDEAVSAATSGAGEVVAEPDVDGDGVPDALVSVTDVSCSLARHRPSGWTVVPLTTESPGECLGTLNTPDGPLVVTGELGHDVDYDEHHHSISLWWRTFRLTRANALDGIDAVYEDRVEGDVANDVRRFEVISGALYDTDTTPRGTRQALVWDEHHTELHPSGCWQRPTDPPHAPDAPALCELTRHREASLRDDPAPRAPHAAVLVADVVINVLYPAPPARPHARVRTYCVRSGEGDFGYLDLTPAEIARCNAPH